MYGSREKGIMKDSIETQRQPRQKVTKLELSLAVIIVYLLIKLYAPTPGSEPEHNTHEKEIFICHAPLPNLLNDHEIDRSAFDADIKWAKELLEGVVKGNNGYGQAADSITLSIFLPNGPPIIETGFGRVRANESDSPAPDGDSIYRMASITKTFTTAQLLLQKQQGQLDLDQDISTILKDFNPSTKGWVGSGEKRRITTRQLLSHTSGLTRSEIPTDIDWPFDSGDLDTTPPTAPTRKEIMSTIRNTPAVLGRSTIPIYSNTGFAVAGFVAEAIGKVKYTSLLHRDIFKPLGMTSSSFLPQADKLDRTVVPSEPVSEWADWDMGDTNPAGGLYCSAADLRLFGQELLSSAARSSKKAQSTHSIFDTITTREWLRPVHIFDDNLLSTGLSWEIFTVPVGDRRMSLYSKGGTLPSYHTLFGIDPEREFGYSLLISGEPTGNTDLAIRIMKRFAATLDIQRQSILSADFAGVYKNDDSNYMKVELIDGGLGIREAVIDGIDLFDKLHLGEGEGNYVALWPTGEHNAWRIAIGRPPAQPYTGCMHKFASIDPAVARGFPVDLIVIEDGKLVYGAVNQTFVKAKN